MQATREQLRASGWTDAQINSPIFQDMLHDLAAERRARNIMATLALVGWVLALAALGGAV